MRIAMTGMGERNHTAFARAAAIGNLVAGGAILLGEAAAALLAAALECGLPADEAEVVVANGLERGMATPRQVGAR